MADLSSIRKEETGLPFCDLSMEDGDLKMGDGIETFILKALLTDQRVSVDEYTEAKIGNPESDNITTLRGWWGDTYSEVPGYKIGSKLWLNVRQKETTKVLENQIEYVKLALNPLIEDGIASKIDVSAEWIKKASTSIMRMYITVYKPTSPSISFAYNFMWEGL